MAERSPIKFGVLSILPEVQMINYVIVYLKTLMKENYEKQILFQPEL